MRRGQRRREEPSRGDGEMSKGLGSSLQERLEASKERWEMRSERAESSLQGRLEVSSLQGRLEASKERWRLEEGAKSQRGAFKERSRDEQRAESSLRGRLEASKEG